MTVKPIGIDCPDCGTGEAVEIHGSAAGPPAWTARCATCGRTWDFIDALD